MPRKGELKMNLVGRLFMRLTVTMFAGRSRRQACWLCACTCGQMLIVPQCSLTSGNTSSCGCLRVDLLRERSTKHGHRPLGKASPTYKTWSSMISRCRSKADDNRALDYARRGIRVCERWHTFLNFLADMGERPDGKTLDRIDNDGNYEQSNCRWATPGEQMRNRRSSERTALDRSVARSFPRGAAHPELASAA